MKIVSKVSNIDTYLNEMSSYYCTSSFKDLESIGTYVEEYLNLLSEKEVTYKNRNNIQGFIIKFNNGTIQDQKSIKSFVEKIKKLYMLNNKQEYIIFTKDNIEFEIFFFSRFIILGKNGKEDRISNIIRTPIIYNHISSGVFIKLIQVTKSIIKLWTVKERKRKEYISTRESIITLKEYNKKGYEYVEDNVERYISLLSNYNSVVLYNLYQYTKVYK